MAVSTQERWKEHNETGRRHFERAEFAEAEQAYVAALRQATLLGAVTLTELGQVSFSLRDFQQSESYFRRALTIREQALGTESLELMQALNDLAAPYYDFELGRCFQVQRFPFVSGRGCVGLHQVNHFMGNIGGFEEFL